MPATTVPALPAPPRRDGRLEAVVVRERPDSAKKPIPAALRQLIEDGIVR